MKRRLCFIFALTFLLAALTACGNDDFVGGPGAGGEPDSSTAVSSEGAGIATLEADPAPGESAFSGESSEESEPEKSASSTSMVYEFRDGVEYRVPMDEPIRFAPEEYQGVWETMRLMGVDGDSLTAVSEDGEMLAFVTPQAWAFTGDVPHDIQELRPGMTVRVGYDGEVLETWPGQITADYLIVEEDDGGLVSVYVDMISGLVDKKFSDWDLQYYGFHFSGEELLTQAEGEAIGWMIATSRGVTPLFGTVTDLAEQGYIATTGPRNDPLSWNESTPGIAIRVETTDVTETEKAIKVDAWYGNVGGFGFSVAVKKIDGKWEIDDVVSVSVA